MSLKIVSGGTTGAADGTLVDSGHPIVFTAIDTPIDAHIRMDDDTYGTSVVFQMATTAGPAVGKGDLQVSLDGGSTWHGWSDNPIAYGSDLGDVNVAIKLRQHAAAPPGDTAGGLDTDGTFTAATALADVTGFTVTPGNAQNAVSWSAVTNRTRYQVDRATNSGFTTGVTLGVYTGTGTSFTDTSLTNGTTYYYRIKAVGTVRYKDSANFATANGQPASTTTTTIDANAGGFVRNSGGSNWATHRAAADGTAVNTTATDGMPFWYADATSGVDLYNDRGGYRFPLTTLPSGLTVASARFGISVTSRWSTSGVACIVNGTQADPLTTADYDNLAGTTEWANRIASSGMTIDGSYVWFDLNTAGKTAIQTAKAGSGILALAIRSAYDLDNSAPVGGGHGIAGHSQAHATLKPRLEVTYS